MERLLSFNLLESLGLTLLHSLWELAVLGLALYLGLMLLSRKSARLRYGISVVTMALMALAPAVTFFILYTPEVPIHDANQALVWMLQGIDPANWQVVRESELSAGGMLDRFLDSYRMISPYIVGVWFAGALFLAVRLAGGYVYSRRMRTTGVEEAPEKLREMLALLQRKMGMLHPVKLLISRKVNVPMALGHLRPVVLLPVSMLTGLTDTQIECILIHELAHIRRYDYLVNLLQRVVEIALFFHPAVWIVSKYIREERENACDEIVVSMNQNKMEYVNALLKVENIRANASLAMAATGGSLFARIKRIMEKTQQKPNYSHGALFLVLFGVAIVLFMYNGLRKEKETEESSEVAFASLNPPKGPDYQPYFFTAQNGDRGYVSPQDSPVKKVTIITKDGEKIESTVDDEGNIQSLKVNGQDVSDSEYDAYAARVNQATKGNVSVTVDNINDDMSPEDRARFEMEMEKFGREMEKLGQGLGEGMEGFGTMMEGLGDMLENLLTGLPADGEMSEEDAAKLEADMERWGEDFGRDMEKWGEEFGRGMERWAENFERRVEEDGDWDGFEERWEKWGEDFEKRMEERSERIERLSEEGRTEEMEAEMAELNQILAEELGENMTQMLAELGEKLGQQFAGLGEELSREMNPRFQDAEEQMDRAREQADRNRERRDELNEKRDELREEADRKREEADRQREEMQRIREESRNQGRDDHSQARNRDKAVEKMLERELVRDRLIDKGDDWKFRMTNKSVWVNGKKLDKTYHTKYMDMVNDHTLIDLHKTGKFELEFEK